MQRIQDENAELRADVKFLMDQNTLMVDYMAKNPAVGKFQHPVVISLATTQGHRILIPEVSDLITSLNQLTSHNFELLKRVPEITCNIGPIKKFTFSFFFYFLIAIFDIFQDIHAALKPFSAQIADVEENIQAIVRRNNVVDEEMQGMKNDIQSLSDKILVIKVSFIRYLI